MSILDDLEIYQTDELNDNIRDTENINNNDSDGDERLAGSDGENDPDNKDGDEDAPKKIEVKKRTTRRNLNVNLNVDMLMGKRGVHTIENYYKDLKFGGRGHERNDLNSVMKRLEHWSHRLYPKYGFDDNLASIENLGKKKVLQVHMTKYRRNMLVDQTEQLQNADSDGSDVEAAPLEYFDEIDELLDKQIQISKVDRTHNNTTNISRDLEFNSLLDNSVAGPSTSILAEPLDTSIQSLGVDGSPQPGPSSAVSTTKTLSAEQMAKIHENRMRALQIRKEKQNRLAEDSLV